MTPPLYEIDSPIKQHYYADEETMLLPAKKNAKVIGEVEHDDVSMAPRLSRVWLREAIGMLAAFCVAGVVFFKLCEYVRRPAPFSPLADISIAMIGNSMMYFNDMPRFLETLSESHITQNSCLHGDASLLRILETGNGMYGKFNTTNALNKDGVYDFGACTPKQLIFGHDEDLERQVWTGVSDLRDDQTNPCLRDPSYLTYLNDHVFREKPKYDFIVINDNTRNPGRASTRASGLRMLQEVYVPWFLETGATPIFFDTHAYSTNVRNMSGFDDIPTFTSLTYEGYKEYTMLATQLLPPWQAPRLAPVGIAFLTIWEEDRHLWHKLFHNFDHLHASPYGSLLTGCIIFYALYGRMPDRKVVFQSHDMSLLWSRARVMQPIDQLPNPFPTYAEAQYLYDVAERVAVLGHLPKSLKVYENSEAAPGLKM